MSGGIRLVDLPREQPPGSRFAAEMLQARAAQLKKDLIQPEEALPSIISLGAPELGHRSTFDELFALLMEMFIRGSHRVPLDLQEYLGNLETTHKRAVLASLIIRALLLQGNSEQSSALLQREWNEIAQADTKEWLAASLALFWVPGLLEDQEFAASYNTRFLDRLGSVSYLDRKYGLENYLKVIEKFGYDPLITEYLEIAIEASKILADREGIPGQIAAIIREFPDPPHSDLRSALLASLDTAKPNPFSIHALANAAQVYHQLGEIETANSFLSRSFHLFAAPFEESRKWLVAAYLGRVCDRLQDRTALSQLLENLLAFQDPYWGMRAYKDLCRALQGSSFTGLLSDTRQRFAQTIRRSEGANRWGMIADFVAALACLPFDEFRLEYLENLTQMLDQLQPDQIDKFYLQMLIEIYCHSTLQLHKSSDGSAETERFERILKSWLPALVSTSGHWSNTYAYLGQLLHLIDVKAHMWAIKDILEKNLEFGIKVIEGVFKVDRNDLGDYYNEALTREMCDELLEVVELLVAATSRTPDLILQDNYQKLSYVSVQALCAAALAMQNVSEATENDRLIRLGFDLAERNPGILERPWSFEKLLLACPNDSVMRQSIESEARNLLPTLSRPDSRYGLALVYLRTARGSSLDQTSQLFQHITGYSSQDIIELSECLDGLLKHSSDLNTIVAIILQSAAHFEIEVYWFIMVRAAEALVGEHGKLDPDLDLELLRMRDRFELQ